MAKLGLPPPPIIVDLADLPIVTLAPGTTLMRIYDPRSTYRPRPRGFRANGPRLRSDHHRGAAAGSVILPADDPDRAVYYAAFTLSGAVVEVFGDARVIERGSFRVVSSTLREAMDVLDLRADAAMRAGVLAAIGSVEQRDVTQAWARYFYETYPAVGGLLYANAHNGEDALALFERVRPVIDRARQVVIRLARPDMEEHLLRIAARTGMIVV